jgi:hypothetical protein
MTTSEALNIKRVDIFLRSPMNICMPHFDKQSDGQGHWKTARGKLLTKIWKQIEFSKKKEDLV